MEWKNGERKLPQDPDGLLILKKSIVYFHNNLLINYNYNTYQ